MPRTLYRVSEENAPNNPPFPITPPYVIICTSFISSMDCINFVCITISLKRPIVPKSDNTETNTVKIITVCRDQQTTIRHFEGSLNVSVGVVNKKYDSHILHSRELLFSHSSSFCCNTSCNHIPFYMSYKAMVGF